MNNNMLVDAWRVKNPDGEKFSWRCTSQTLAMARLDYFLIANSLMGSVDEIDIVPGFKSDHSILHTVLKLD